MADPSGALESSAYFSGGGCAPTPDHDADYASRKRRVATEQRRLLQWAENNGFLALSSRLPPPFAEGGEHRVYFQRRTRRYLKATRPDRQKGYGIALGSITHGATPSEYLDRLSLQNRIFNDDIRLEKILPNDDAPIIVTSQPAIKGPSPTQIQLDDLMVSKGYERFTEGAYYDSPAGLLIFDLFPRNAILAPDGFVYPIDPVIQRVTSEFGDFLRDCPYTINLR